MSLISGANSLVLESELKWRLKWTFSKKPSGPLKIENHLIMAGKIIAVWTQWQPLLKNKIFHKINEEPTSNIIIQDKCTE